MKSQSIRIYSSYFKKMFLVICALALAIPAYAGDIDSPAVPSDDAGRMYTVEQIYQKVLSGTTPTKQSGGFNEPAAGPASTMHTLDDIEGKIVAGTTTATAGDILNTKTAIARGAGTGETLITGSIATQTLSAANDTVTAGYYTGTTLSTVDTDLATANIKSGVTIFGKAGDANVVNTSSGDAVAGEILTGKKAWVDGSEVTGNVAAGANVSGADGSKTFTITDGLYAGSKTATANDSDLVAGNIKDTIVILGVTGTYTGVGGTVGLPKTGQTTSYADYDDGYYEKGIARSYTDNGDGTITDNATGLMWAKDGNGAGCNNGATITWAAALTWAEGLTFATYSDWRLPNVYELYSICLLEPTHGAPFIDTNYFTNTVSSRYWSATTYPLNTDYALYVHFVSGYVRHDNKTSSYYVRAVRGGQ